MTKQEAMNEAAEAELYRLEGVVLTRSVIRDVFLNGWIAADNHAARSVPESVPAYDVQQAAEVWRLGRYQAHGMEPQYTRADLDLAYSAGAAWQKERDTRLVDEAINTGLYVEQSFQDEVRNALGTLGEGMAELMRKQDELQAAGYRGSDRGVAILKHLQEIGDNVRGVSGAIGDKFGVVLDAVKDVGEKVEACMTIASNTEEGLAVSIEKLDKLGVEKWREAIKHVEAEGTTEPMHAKVKAEPVIIESNPEAPGDWVKSAFMRGKVKAADYDESGLGKLWADVTVNLEDVSDETLRELAVSGQISEARYFEEYSRRSKPVDPGYGPRVDTDKVTFRPGLLMRDGEVKVEKLGERIIVLYGGRLYDLRGMALHPLRFVA